MIFQCLDEQSKSCPLCKVRMDKTSIQDWQHNIQRQTENKSNILTFEANSFVAFKTRAM